MDKFLTRQSLAAEMFSGTILECGVRTGYFSNFILNNCKVDKLYGVDINDSCIEYPILSNTKYNFLKMDAIAAAEQFAAEGIAFDVIYLDDDHRRKHVSKELQVYFPLLKKGGILASHDYVKGLRHSDFGVVEAFEEFAAERGLQLYITGVGQVSKPERIGYAMSCSTWVEETRVLKHQEVVDELHSFNVPDKLLNENFCPTVYFRS